MIFIIGKESLERKNCCCYTSIFEELKEEKKLKHEEKERIQEELREQATLEQLQFEQECKEKYY